ncbi:MAG: zinc-finger domain-containing protein [Corynebacterium matruchotii]|uniref:zinc-finger domain-containing protein n=2 Tax=Corynebacterium matruchotii TaxID=43768 RepID=UPI0035CF27F5
MLRFVKHLMKGYCSDIPLKNRHNYRSGCHNGAHRLCAPPGWQHECADCYPHPAHRLSDRTAYELPHGVAY